MKIEKIVHHSEEYGGDYNSDPRYSALVITPQTMEYIVTEKNGEQKKSSRKTPEKEFKELIQIIERNKFFSYKVADEFDYDRPHNEEKLSITTDSKTKTISLSISVIPKKISDILDKMHEMWDETQ